MTDKNQQLYKLANSYQPSDLRAAHALLLADPARYIGEIPLLCPIRFYELEGEVWCVSSFTQIAYSGKHKDWQPPIGYQSAD